MPIFAELQKLIEFYQSKTHDLSIKKQFESDINLFRKSLIKREGVVRNTELNILKSIKKLLEDEKKILEDNLLANTTQEKKLVGKKSLEPTKTNQSSIKDQLLSKVKSLLDVQPEISSQSKEMQRILDFISPLSEQITHFQEQDLNLYIPIENMKQTIEEFHQNFFYMLPSSTEFSSSTEKVFSVISSKHHRKKKPVLISDEPTRDSLKEEHIKLTQDIKKLEDELGAIEKEFPIDSKDPLINSLIIKVKQLKEEFENAKKERKNKEMEIECLNLATNHFFPTSLDNPSLDEKTKTEILKFVHYFQEQQPKKSGVFQFSSKGSPDIPQELSQKLLDFIHQQIEVLQKKHKAPRRSELKTISFEIDRNYFKIQTEYFEELLKPLELFHQRQDELKQLNKEPTQSAQTTRGLVKLQSRIEELFQERSIIQEEISNVFQSMEILPNEKDPNILDLKRQATEISDKLSQTRKKALREIKHLKSQNAFEEIPLEADRLLEIIKCQQTLIKTLGEIKKEAEIVSTKYKEKKDLRDKKVGRILGAHKAKIEKLRKTIIRIQQNPLYNSQITHNDTLSELEAKTILSSSVITMSKEDELKFIKISSKSMNSLLQDAITELEAQEVLFSPAITWSFNDAFEHIKSLDREMDPFHRDLKEKIWAKNIQYINNLSPAFKLTQTIKDNGLKDPQEVFPHLFQLEKLYKSLVKNSNQEINPNLMINLINCNSIIDKANALWSNILQRQANPLTQIIQTICKSIQTEISNSTSNQDLNKILQDLKNDLEAKLKEFIISGSGDPVQIFTTTIMNHLSPQELSKLFDLEKGAFIVLIRKLLEPLINFIKKMTGEKYRPNFFASHTEVRVSKAAQTAYENLNSLLDSPTPEHHNTKRHN